MSVRVLFFSVLQDISGCEETVWKDAAPTLAGLLEQIYERWPALKAWDGSLLTAINHEYVKRDAVLTPGCEVAIMPPVQGG